MGAVVALVGRQVDIATSLIHIGFRVSGDLLSGRVPSATRLDNWREPSSGVPLLREMQETVSLIPEDFSGAGSINELGISGSDEKPPSTFLVTDAFSNLDHLKFRAERRPCGEPLLYHLQLHCMAGH